MDPSQGRCFQVECVNGMLDGTMIVALSAVFSRGRSLVSVSDALNLRVPYAERASVSCEYRDGRFHALIVVCRRPNGQVEVKRDGNRRAMSRYARYGHWSIQPAHGRTLEAPSISVVPIELLHV